jgi:hypothetical protein
MERLPGERIVHVLLVPKDGISTNLQHCLGSWCFYVLNLIKPWGGRVSICIEQGPILHSLLHLSFILKVYPESCFIEGSGLSMFSTTCIHGACICYCKFTSL